MTNQSLTRLTAELKSLANPAQAKILQRFFKTGKGGYGEGDIFLGIKVPVQRAVAKKYESISLKDILHLLNSKIHEERLVSLIILASKFKKSSQDEKRIIFKLYLKNTKNINNWDLVDLSAPNIVGNYLLENGAEKAILKTLAKSKSLWNRRISVVSTYAFIRNNQFSDTIALAEILLADTHDLIHKAVGWMLREVGKRSPDELKSFLDAHCKTMPRTMLRYAIEKLPESERKFYLGERH